MSKKIVIECDLCNGPVGAAGIGFIWESENQHRPDLYSSDRWQSEQCFTHVCSKCVVQIEQFRQLTQQGGADDLTS